ncbi:tetratricopeptide repeat protein [Aquimarina sp. RZ0]|nr:tetratricopeptide repeat protein [Aquimarina sp. RZ0]
MLLINNYNIALLYHSIKEYDLAIKQLKKTLIFGENILGKDHFELARCYKLMGNIYKEKKEYDKASHFLNKALLMTKKGLRVCLT